MNVGFERIYYNQLKKPGKLRIADSGVGWKFQGGTPFLFPSNEIVTASWSRASRGYELRILTKDNKIASFDGFPPETFNQLKNEFKHKFSIDLDNKEHALRGWNWGTTTMARGELIFNINNKPDFELPYDEISNTNLTGKNEVAVELKQDQEDSKDGDELVEIRFYVPGTVPVENSNPAPKKDKVKNGENGEKVDGKQEGEEEEEEEKVQEQSAAAHFYEQLKDRASLGQVSGESIVAFSDVFFLTPRGRYDVDMYNSSLRLRGKTYDNKVQYRSIERVFSLPKPDEVHHLVVIQVDPPLTQGQTRYSFLTIQFPREELMDVELNVTDEEYKERFADKLKRKYTDEKTHNVIAQCLKGLTDIKVTVPGMYRSKHNQSAVSCSLKASEGYLYFLDKCFLFVIKPTVYLPFSEVASVHMSRVSQTTTVSKTFDLEVVMRNGTSHNFANISREEQKFIENFLIDKNVKVKNEEEEGKKLLDSAFGGDDDDDIAGGHGSNEDDDESEDEDFNEEDASDESVPEDYDSEASASDGGAEEDEPPKKKSKK